ELPARRRCMPKGGVMGRRHQERDMRFTEDAGLVRWVDVDGYAKRVDDVRTPATTRYRTIAVLRDMHPTSRDDDRRGGRDIERMCAGAACATGVEDLVEPVLDRAHHRTQGFSGRDNDFRRLAPQSKRRREGANLHGSPCAREDGSECGPCILRS